MRWKTVLVVFLVTLALVVLVRVARAERPAQAPKPPQCPPSKPQLCGCTGPGDCVCDLAGGRCACPACLTEPVPKKEAGYWEENIPGVLWTWRPAGYVPPAQPHYGPSHPGWQVPAYQPAFQPAPFRGGFDGGGGGRGGC